VEDFRNCPVCGKIFLRKTRNLCPACLALEEKNFDVVRKFLYAHPGATIPEITSHTGVVEETILQFFKEGRLQSKGGVSVLHCKVCGMAINQGEYCQNCLNYLSKQFVQTQPAEGKVNLQKNPQKMYTKDTN
jgi:flagellar operon protein (TIGR03826 family)